MKTTLHAYNFDINKSGEREAYDALCADMKTQGVKCFATHGGNSHYVPQHAGEIELETKTVFDNQWNTVDRLRVFDWAEDACLPAKWMKRGHYLTITNKMREIRRNTNSCGYCGNQEPATKGTVFCGKCIGSEYLQASDLKLTRMWAVDEGKNKRPDLTEREAAMLLPLYRQAQIHGTEARDDVRIAAQREAYVSSCTKAIDAATTERDGFLWLMDNAIKTSLAIYYKHTGRFAFGWRRPIGATELGELKQSLSGFPFPYDIKTED